MVNGTSYLTLKIFSHLSKKHGGPYCGEPNSGNIFIEEFKFWVSGVSVVVVGFSGLVWNIIALITILSMKKKSVFHKLLICLTIFDILFLLSAGIFMIHQSMPFESQLFNILFPNLIYPLAGISMTGEFFNALMKLSNLSNSE